MKSKLSLCNKITHNVGEQISPFQNIIISTLIRNNFFHTNFPRPPATLLFLQGLYSLCGLGCTLQILQGQMQWTCRNTKVSIHPHYTPSCPYCSPWSSVGYACSRRDARAFLFQFNVNRKFVTELCLYQSLCTRQRCLVNILQSTMGMVFICKDLLQHYSAWVNIKMEHYLLVCYLFNFKMIIWSNFRLFCRNLRRIFFL